MHLRRTPLIASAAAVALAGCGADKHADQAQPTPTATPEAKPAAKVVYFTRVVGTDPVQDTLEVTADRKVEVKRIRGHAGARFDHYTLTAGELTRLRGQLKQLGTAGETAPDISPNKWHYTMRVGDGAMRDFVDGKLNTRVKPAVKQLEDLIDTSATRDPTYKPH